jgi:hypothetical protein
MFSVQVVTLTRCFRPNKARLGWIGLLIAAFLCATPLGVRAGGPVFWEISRQDEVVKGDARGVSIADNGAISLAPALNLVFDTKEAYIWSSAVDSAGNIYLGTGHDGRIYRVAANGSGRLLYDAPELDVTALATDSAGNLYAATSPDGKIYKIAPSGEEHTFYDPPDKYIWSLVIDPKTSTLYAGTGDKGVIYKIDPAGKASVLADTTETNILTLAIDGAGGVLAGTDPSGLVLRITPEGKQFALLDSPTQEIHSIAAAPDGSLYVLGINQQPGAAGHTSAGVSTTSTLSAEGTVTISASDEEGPSQPQETVTPPITLSTSGRSKAEGARSALFRVNADGTNDVLWRSNDALGFSVRPAADGRVLIGTNNKGRIYEVGADRSRALLLQSPEDQTSTLISVGDRIYATSSNLGRLYEISHDPVQEGSYTSPVRDTRFAGQWGVITWRGAGNVELQTRTGNTETPDATWSDWSPVYKKSTGDQVTSPRARFIQWRATLRNSTGAQPRPASGRRTSDATRAQLQSVAVAYLPRNQSPDLASLQVLAPGIALQEQPIAIDPSIATSGLDPQLFGVVASIPPRRFYQKGARTLTWQATDPNDDLLTYKVFYRSIEDNDWHQLASGLSQAWYTIDLNRVPDGTYLFKVVASDAPSNPAELALSDEQVSEPIEIDNTPPVIKPAAPRLNGHSAEVVFDVSDSTSRIIKGEYSVDGAPWQMVFPVDGIADSASESYKLQIKFESTGEHVVAFRSTDSSLNVGTAKVTCQVR